ncbi:hypothetical protein OSTOST_02832 [Ostertagia ostertagi]
MYWHAGQPAIMLYFICLLVIFGSAIHDGDNAVLGPGSPLTIAGPANNNGKSLKAGGGSATNTNQGKNLPLLNSSDQEVEWLLNKIRQSLA